MTEKNSHIGMQCCVYCKEPKGILLSTKYKANGESAINIPRYCFTDPEPCDKCKEEFKAKGCVPMWSVHPGKHGEIEYDGRYAMIKREKVHGQNFINMIEKLGFLIMQTDEFSKAFKDILESKNNNPI